MGLPMVDATHQEAFEAGQESRQEKISNLRAEIERLAEKLAGEQESGAALVTLNDGLLSLNRKYLAEVSRLRRGVQSMLDSPPLVIEIANELLAEAVRP